MQKPKILIVDDEEQMRSTLNSFLSDRVECEIYEAADGYKAIESFKKNIFDLIILDIRMPGISGIDVIKEAKKISPDVKIIVITKWDSPEVSRQVEEQGADYMPKPFSLKVLQAKIKEALTKMDKFIPKTY